MIISDEVYTWLVQSKLINLSDAAKKGDDNYEVTKTVQSQFENGILFAKIAKYMAKIIGQSQNRPATPLNLDNLKELNSPAAKIYNWNLLTEAFRKFNVTVDSDAKSLIVVGDQETIQLVLYELYQTCMTWTNPVEQSQLYDQNMSYGYQEQQKQARKNKDYKETIDLTRLDPSKDPSKAKTCLEFLIIILSKHLELDPKQTASLFTHGNKYLAHVLAKGVKGLFDPIIEFYTEIYSHISTLIRLFKEDPTRKSMVFTLNALKPGMVSKSFEVSEWAARLFSRLAFDFGETNLLVHAWEWFIGEGGGLNTTLLSLKRHPDLKTLIVTILLEFARYNFVELFITHLKRALPDPKDLINIQLQLFDPLMKQKLSREEMVQTGILDDWIDLSFTVAGDEYRSSADLKAVGLSFLSEVWLQYPAKIEDFEYKANNLVNLLAKAARDKFSPLVFASLALQFKLLLQFGVDKNPYAPVIYKTLTLALIEHHANSNIREFMVNNFMTVYEQIDTIPINILLEPLIKQIQVSEQSIFSYNIFDFNFFAYVSKNPKLPIKNAIQLLDLLAKVYLNNIIFAEMAGEPILQLIQMNLDNETMHEFVLKFVKISLAMYYASEKKKKTKEKILPLYNGQSYNSGRNPGISPQELDNEIMQAQKRSLIVSVIMSVIDLNNKDLNEKILPLVAHSNIQLMKIRGKENKGMMAILAQFGDPDHIMLKYQAEYNEHQSLLKQEERDALEKEQSMIALVDRKPFSLDSRDETMMLIEANLQKYNSDTNLGKSIINKISKSELTKLALLRNPKADPKVLKQLDEIKANFSMKEDLKSRIKENNETMIDNQKKNLRYQMEQRSIELGVKPLNCKVPLDDRVIRPVVEPKQAIYKLGAKEKELLREGKLMPEITYIDLNLEEQRDQEMVRNILKMYHKALKFNFLKYANTGFNVNQAHTSQKLFDGIKEQKETISVAEIWKWVKDYDLEDVRNERHFVLHQLISQDEHKSLVKLVNIQGLGRKNENQELDFKGFELYFINFCSWVCNRPPANLGHLPLSYSVQYVITRLRQKTLESKEKYEKARQESVRNPLAMNNVNPLNASIVLYDDPEGSYLGEEEIVKTYNKELEKDPNMVLPQGYAKKKERIITFDYKLNKLKGFNPVVLMAYELLDEILMNGTSEKNRLGLKIIEPKSNTVEVTRCHPLVNSGMKGQKHVYDHLLGVQPAVKKDEPKPSDAPLIDHKEFNKKDEFTKHMKKRAMLTSQSLHSILPGSTFDVVKEKYSKKKNLPIDNYHNLNIAMKVEISKAPYKDRWVAEQCAYILDDVLKVAIQEDKNFREEKDKKMKYKFHRGLKADPDQPYTFVKEGLFHPDNAVKKGQRDAVQPTKEELKKKEEYIQKLRQENLKWAQEPVYDKDHLKKNNQLKQETAETKKKVEEDKTKEEEKKKKDEEFREKWLKHQKDKTKEQLKFEADEKDLQERKAAEREKKQKEEFKKQFDSYNKQKKEDIHKQMLELEQKRKDKLEADKKKQKEWQDRKELLYTKIMDSGEKRTKYEQEVQKRIQDLYESEPIKEVFKTNHKKLLLIFELLNNYTYRDLKRDPNIKWERVKEDPKAAAAKPDDKDPKQQQQQQQSSQNVLPNEEEGEVEKSVIQGGAEGKKPAAKKKQLHELFYEEINLKTFTWFCYKFNLYPEILHPTDSILIYRSLTSKKRPLDIKEEDPLRDISKAGGVLKVGLNFEEFKQALLRLAIKGKKIFNIFAVNLQQAAMSSSTMKHQVLEAEGGQGEGKAEQSGVGDESGAIQKTSKLVDEYGKIEECTADTLRCLLFYLGFPKDKMGIEERFRQVMEQNVQDDKKHKKLLEEKFFLQDPQMLEEFYKLQKIDPNLSIMDVSKIDLNRTMQQSKIVKKEQ